MKAYKKILLILIFLSILCLVAGYIVWHPSKIGLCPVHKILEVNTCENKFPVDSLGRPLFMTSIFIIPIFILLFFLPEIFYLAWRRFALVLGTIGIILISITPPFCGGYICMIQKDGVTLSVGSLFFIISLLIIFYQSFKLWKKK